MFKRSITQSGQPMTGRRGRLPALVLLFSLAAMAWDAPAHAKESLPAGLHRLGEPRPVNAVTTPKWQAVLERHGQTVARARQACASGAPDACALEAWQGFLARVAEKPLWERLRHVNVFINRVPYADDMESWGRVDRWAAPQDFLGRGGDCEDYAVAKYLSLRALGLPARDMMLTAFFDAERGREHLVLVVLLPGGAVVLDNESDFVLPWRAFGPYRPIYLLNEESALFEVAAR